MPLQVRFEATPTFGSVHVYVDVEHVHDAHVRSSTPGVQNVPAGAPGSQCPEVHEFPNPHDVSYGPLHPVPVAFAVRQVEVDVEQ